MGTFSLFDAFPLCLLEGGVAAFQHGFASKTALNSPFLKREASGFVQMRCNSA